MVEQPGSDVHLSRVFDANFDIARYTISSDIIKELCGFYGVSTETDYLKSELETAVKEEAEEEGLEINPIEQLFIEYIFTRQDNNDGKLFVDILEGGIKYCFLARSGKIQIISWMQPLIWYGTYKTVKRRIGRKTSILSPNRKRTAERISLLLARWHSL